MVVQAADLDNERMDSMVLFADDQLCHDDGMGGHVCNCPVDMQKSSHVNLSLSHTHTHQHQMLLHKMTRTSSGPPFHGCQRGTVQNKLLSLRIVGCSGLETPYVGS